MPQFSYWKDPCTPLTSLWFNDCYILLIIYFNADFLWLKFPSSGYMVLYLHKARLPKEEPKNINPQGLVDGRCFWPWSWPIPVGHIHHKIYQKAPCSTNRGSTPCLCMQTPSKSTGNPRAGSELFSANWSHHQQTSTCTRIHCKHDSSWARIGLRQFLVQASESC